MKWLKLYVDIAQNPRIKLLAFEDRWHYISLLCAKAEGYLDERPELRDRMVSVHLGLTPSELENVKDRLVDVGLISDEWQIYNWDEKQSKDATGAARKRRERARKKAEKEAAATTKEIRSKNIEENVTVTGQSRDSHATKKHGVYKVKCPLPKKWAEAGLTEDHLSWAKEKGISDGLLAEHFACFCEKAKAGGYKYNDWNSAFYTAVRQDWAKINSRAADKGPTTDAGVIAA